MPSNPTEAQEILTAPIVQIGKIGGPASPGRGGCRSESCRATVGGATRFAHPLCPLLCAPGRGRGKPPDPIRGPAAVGAQRGKAAATPPSTGSVAPVVGVTFAAKNTTALPTCAPLILARSRLRSR